MQKSDVRGGENGLTRRGFLAAAGAAGVGALAAGSAVGGVMTRTAARGLTMRGGEAELFKISLAQWSLHRTLFDGKLDHLDFAKTAKEKYGIEAIEYVNAFFKDKARDKSYLEAMNVRAKDHAVKQLLIMCDGEGALGDPDEAKRAQAVENHRKWLEAAAMLGCHSIRVNAQSSGSWDEQQRLAADGLAKLTTVAEPFGLNVIVENHGGLSSNGAWLSGVMKMVGMERCGTLPDFGNFRVSESEQYDRYKGVAELMPFAKAVSAKSRVFDEQGNEAETDYDRMMRIVLDAGYRGWVGIEWEGSQVSEEEGVRKTKALLERVRGEMAKAGKGTEAGS